VASGVALIAGLLAVLLGGCGSSSPTTAASPHLSKATLILDFVPNAVHAGIYQALAAGYYRQQGIELGIIQPSATTDPLKLIDAGSAQFGLADGSDVAGLIAAGGDAQAMMALVQRPVGGLIGLASERLHTPADLQGKTVGITGVPSDKAVLDTEVAHAGGNPSKVHVVTIGFNGAQALAAGKIAAFTGFIPADGVQLQVGGRAITAFALDRYGGPAYPGLVAFTTRREIASDPALVRGFVAATVHGYEDTLADPKRSLQELLAANPTLQKKFTQASLAAYLPLFAGAANVPFGTLQARNIEALSGWMLANHLVSSPVSAGRYGTNRFLP
jgi:ABC-type nitrate/sulfonate/bicarbonate transport system substrate-binding protein